MPLPEGTLSEIKERTEAIKASIENMEGIIADLRASGIDALKREEELAGLRERLRNWETFYNLQMRRTEGGK